MNAAGGGGAAPRPSPARGAPDDDPDEALSTRLRDLALVELDALTAGLEDGAAGAMIAAFADDAALALAEARARLVELRGQLGGADALAVLDAPAGARASEAAAASVPRLQARLLAQAGAARAHARIGELAAALLPRFVEATRRR